jgi:hypothetical protein
MLELTVTPFRADEAPAIRLDQPNDLAHLHETTVSHRDQRRSSGLHTGFTGRRSLRGTDAAKITLGVSSSFLSA